MLILSSSFKKILFIIFFMIGLAGATEPFEIKLWDKNPPGKNCVEGEEIIENWSSSILDRHIQNISNPTLTVYLPSTEKFNGTGVVICPGGGYRRLAIDKEGHDVARWLNEIGVAGFVLKYRLPCPQKGNVVFLPQLDVQRAIRLVRYRAKEWNLDPQKIGVMGFSAGGHLASTAGTHFDYGNENAADPIERQSSRPDFMILIYPFISMTKDYAHPGSKRSILGDNLSMDWKVLYSNELQVTENTPPAFLISTEDDRVSARHSIDFFLALKEAGVPAELHIYAEGGHGYGLRQTGKPVSVWPKLCEKWMKNMNLIH